MAISDIPFSSLIEAPIFIIAFLLLLSLIVFVHEYGHFSVARLLGVKVEVFSIGFGKTIAQWVDKKGTEWRIALLPLGGYVKFFGDAGPASNPGADVESEKASAGGPGMTQFPKPGEEKALASRMTPEERKVCFHFKPVWARAAIVAAGPMFNFLLAIGIFWMLIMIYGDRIGEPKIAIVDPGSASEEAGFLPGDLLMTANGRKIENFNDLVMLTRLSSGEELTFGVKRGEEDLTIKATPRRQEVTDGLGNKTELGVLGIRGSDEAVRYGPVEAVGVACKRVWGIIASTGKFLSRLVVGKEDASQLGGPIKIAQYAGQAAKSGFNPDDKALESLSVLARLQLSLATFINLAAVMSVSVGLLNLLPVPVLDGGHLMYYAYEAAAGRPLGVKAQAIGFRVGIVLLASFMLFVTWNDITGFFAANS